MENSYFINVMSLKPIFKNGKSEHVITKQQYTRLMMYNDVTTYDANLCHD